MTSDHPIRYERCPKRVRVVFDETTIADSIDTGLLLERGLPPVYYFPRPDVRLDLLERSERRTHCPYKGDASYWTVRVGERSAGDAAWSYETPDSTMPEISDRLAFYWHRMDRWLEEDEEVFGGPRDPRHRVDVRPSGRRVRAIVGSTELAVTRRALFLFETDLPTRYYVPRDDIVARLARSQRRTVCPYKGSATYWSLDLGGRSIEDAAWSYEDPLPECPRIKGYVAFDPDKVDRIDVERSSA